MAGSPIKRARRAGIPIPNLGGRLSRAERVRRDEEPLEPDGELAGIAKRVLRNVALRGKDERNCVAAAKALADITAPREMKHRVEFEGFSPDEVEALTKAAKMALESQAAGGVPHRIPGLNAPPASQSQSPEPLE